MTRRRRIFVLLAPLLALGGCAGNPGGVEIIASNDRTLAVDQGAESGSDAAVEGTLALSEGSCWGIEQPDGTFLLVIWPEGTSADGAGIKAPPPAGELALGAPLRLSGGDLTSEEVEAVSEACDESAGFRAWEVEKL